MSFSSLSTEKCDDLENKTLAKVAELEILLKRKPIDLWKQDIQEFVDAYKEYESKELEEIFNAYQAVCKKANIKCINRDFKPTFIGKRKRLDSSVSKSKSSKSANRGSKKSDKSSSVKPKQNKAKKRRKVSEESEISIKSSDLSSIDDSSFELTSNKNTDKRASKRIAEKAKQMPNLSKVNEKMEEEKCSHGSDSNKENNEMIICQDKKEEVDVKQVKASKNTKKSLEIEKFIENTADAEDTSIINKFGNNALEESQNNVTSENQIGQRRKRIIIDSDEEE